MNPNILLPPISEPAIPYSLILFIGSLITLMLCVVALKRRSSKGALAFALAMISISLCFTTEAIQFLIPVLETKVFWVKIQYWGLAFASYFWLVFGIGFSSIRPSIRRLILAPPLIGMAVFFWFSGHIESGNLFWIDHYLDTTTSFPALRIIHGPIWYVQAVQCYIEMIVGTYFLLRAAPEKIGARGSVWGATVAVALLTGIGGLPNILGFTPGPSIDLTPFGIMLAGIAVGWFHLRHNLLDSYLDLAPVARDTIVASLPDAVIILNRDDMIDGINPAAWRLPSLQHKHPLGLHYSSVFEGHLDLPNLLHSNREQTNREQNLEVSLSVEGDLLRHYDVFIKTLIDRKGRPAGRVLRFHDITEWRIAQEALRESEMKFRAVVEQSHEGVYIRTLDSRIALTNAAFERILGYSLSELNEGDFFHLLFPDPDSNQKMRSLSAQALTRKLSDAQVVARRKDGQMIWLQVNASSVRIDSKEFVIGTINDITERKSREDRMSFLATHDELTGLSNRRAVEDSLIESLETRAASDCESVLLFVDTDHFKEVNDNFGHAAGDNVIVEIGRLMRSCLRDTDLLARFGGDEFAILLRDTEIDRAQTVAERLRDCVARHAFLVGDQEVSLSLSIGMVRLDEQTTPRSVLAEADAAMYEAKRTGRNRVVIFRPRVTPILDKTTQIINSLL